MGGGANATQTGTSGENIKWIKRGGNGYLKRVSYVHRVYSKKVVLSRDGETVGTKKIEGSKLWRCMA